MSRVAAGSAPDEFAARGPAAELPSRPSRIRRLGGGFDGVLVLIVAIGAVLRFWGLGNQSLWYDEWLTTEAVSGSLADLFRHTANREGIPPPYFLVVWAWVRVFGDGETALRAVSALAGIATVPIAYAVARELGQRRTVARVAALLTAVSPMLVAYSQEARPYGLLAFLSALSLLAFARARNHGRRPDFVLWGFACAATLAVHYFAVFLVVAEALGLLALRRRQWRDLLLAGVPSVVVLASLSPFALEQYSHSPNHQWISDWPLTDRVSEASRTALVGPNPPHGRLWIPATIVVALAALTLVRRASRADRSAAALVWGIGGAAVVMPLLATLLGLDVVLSRYLIAALIPLIVAVSMGLVAPKLSWVGGVALVVFCAISLTSVVAVARHPDLQKADWHGVADVLEAGTGPRLLVMNAYSNLGDPLRYYLEGERELADGETISVDDINIVVAKTSSAPCNWFVGRACSLLFLGAALPEPLAGEFTLDALVDLDQFTVERYRAREPVPVTKAALVTPVDLPGSLVLVAGR